MICLFCPITDCPDDGIVDGPGCCGMFPDDADGLSAAELEAIAEEDERRGEEEMLIERGICPHCGEKLYSD